MKKLLLFALTAFSSVSYAQNWEAVGTGAGSGPSSSVDVMHSYNNKLLAAGRYMPLQQWDGTSWTDFPGASTATTLFNDGDTIYSGGQFTGGENMKFIKKWNGSEWDGVGTTISSYDSIYWNTNYNYSAITKMNNKLYALYNKGLMWYDASIDKFRNAGNTFNDIGLYMRSLNYAGTMNNKFYYICFAGSDMVNTSEGHSIGATWDGERWDTLNFSSTYSMIAPMSACVHNNELYIAGYFQKADVVYTLIKYNGSAFSEIFTMADTPVNNIKSRGDYILCQYSVAENHFVGAINGNSLSSVGNTTVTENINDFEVYGNHMYAGGFFSSFAGVEANNIARVLKPVVGLDVIEQESDLSIYPNPASNMLTVSSKDKVKSVKIYDLAGSLVLTSTHNNIDISQINNGLYFTSIETEKGIQVKKFVKQ